MFFVRFSHYLHLFCMLFKYAIVNSTGFGTNNVKLIDQMRKQAVFYESVILSLF